MSHTASKTWVSYEAREYEIWVKIQDSLSRIAPKSLFVPKTFKEWLAHKVAKKDEYRQRLIDRIAAKEATWGQFPAPVRKILGGKLLDDQRALVLAINTIWRSLDRGPSQPLAPWPSHEEYRHEGDDRNRSGYSRFPPLPREPGNATVNWKQRTPIRQCPFDEVGRPAIGIDDGDSSFNDPALEFLGDSLWGVLDL